MSRPRAGHAGPADRLPRAAQQVIRLRCMFAEQLLVTDGHVAERQMRLDGGKHNEEQ